MDSQSIVLSYNRPIIQHIIAKRIFDLLFSTFALLLLSPLCLLIALGIKLSSKGTILYRQKRIGRGGKSFECLKFRTMVVGADAYLNNLLKTNPSLKKEWNRNQKLKNDPRIFWLGKFLRKASFDEIPQFWNVLKGDLSVVGPRPYMESQRKDLGPSLYKILSVRPGITGLWQTSGRSNTCFQERIILDAKYVEIRNFWIDLSLIAKTLPALLFSKDAC